MDKYLLSEEERIAFDWAINQQYQSVAARYARLLAGVVQRYQAEHQKHIDAGWLSPEQVRELIQAIDDVLVVTEGICKYSYCLNRAYWDTLIAKYLPEKKE